MFTLQLIMMLAAGIFVGWALFWYLSQRRRAVLVIVDERGGVQAYRARRAPGGIAGRTLNGWHTYPADMVYREAAVTGVNMAVYVAGAEYLPLANHDALEAGRHGIAFGAMFKSGGDLLRFIQMGAAAAVLGSVIWFSLSLGGVQSAMVAQAAQLQVVNETVAKGLVCKVDDGGSEPAD